jgi:hypothetical protein
MYTYILSEKGRLSIHQIILLNPVLEKKRQRERSVIVGDVLMKIRLVESWLANAGDCDADFGSHCIMGKDQNTGADP